VVSAPLEAGAFTKETTMNKVNSLGALPRQRAGKGAARQTRRDGRVPGVIYGNKQEPVMISLEPKELTRQLQKSGFFATLFDVELDGKVHRVLPRDVQFDPVTDRPLHVDFLRIAADTTVHVNVPVIFQNELASPGLKRGGVLNIVRHEIELICAADRIPQTLNFDLTGLDIGDSIHISAVALPEGVTPAIGDRDFTVATIVAPSAQRGEVAGEAAATEAAAPAAGAAAPAAGAAAPAAGKKS
jgi:large subunit ribosomal protein L25